MLSSGGVAEYSQSLGIKSRHISKDSDRMNIQPLSILLHFIFHFQLFYFFTFYVYFYFLPFSLLSLSDTLSAYFKGFQWIFDHFFPSCKVFFLLSNYVFSRIAATMICKCYVERKRKGAKPEKGSFSRPKFVFIGRRRIVLGLIKLSQAASKYKYTNKKVQIQKHNATNTKSYWKLGHCSQFN